MQAKISLFIDNAKKILCETGPLQKRPSWPSLKKSGSELPSINQVGEQMPPDKLLLLALLQTPDLTPQRDEALKNAFSFALQFPPEPEFVSVVTLVSRPELEKNLLPFIYEPGNRGTTACYIAARLSIYLAPEAFQYFLLTRKWSQTDLFNLSLLARQQDIASLCSLLEASAAGQTIPAARETLDEFRFILFNQKAKEPLLPDITAPVKAQEIQQTDTSAHLHGKTAEARPAASTLKKLRDKQHDKDSIPQKQLLAGAFLLLTGVIFWSYSFFSDQESSPVVATRSTKIPSFWTDAVTQKQVTTKFLSADKDYRMGEIFLTRDKFSEALSLFEDAISIDPDHIQALFRIGYCRMKIGDYPRAIEVLQKTLKKNATCKLANLFLARIAIAQKDAPGADKYYSAEIAINKDPAVAMEYANYLNRSGQKSRAESIIEEFQKLYPERMFILSEQDSPALPEKGEKQ